MPHVFRYFRPHLLRLTFQRKDKQPALSFSVLELLTLSSPDDSQALVPKISNSLIGASFTDSMEATLVSISRSCGQAQGQKGPLHSASATIRVLIVAADTSHPSNGAALLQMCWHVSR